MQVAYDFLPLIQMWDETYLSNHQWWMALLFNFLEIQEGCHGLLRP